MRSGSVHDGFSSRGLGGPMLASARQALVFCVAPAGYAGEISCPLGGLFCRALNPAGLRSAVKPAFGPARGLIGAQRPSVCATRGLVGGCSRRREGILRGDSSGIQTAPEGPFNRYCAAARGRIVAHVVFTRFGDPPKLVMKGAAPGRSSGLPGVRYCRADLGCGCDTGGRWA